MRLVPQPAAQPLAVGHSPGSDSDLMAEQATPEPILSARDREILRDVIGTFIATGEPVSSRSLARHEQHGVSSATIRNVMADLEDLGLLTQPHVSAGRVPTQDGYHYYIDTLMPSRAVSQRDRAFIEAALGEEAGGEKLMSSARPAAVRSSRTRIRPIVVDAVHRRHPASSRSASCRCPTARCCAWWSRRAASSITS